MKRSRIMYSSYRFNFPPCSFENKVLINKYTFHTKIKRLQNNIDKEILRRVIYCNNNNKIAVNNNFT